MAGASSARAPSSARAAVSTHEGGELDFSATAVINSLGRQPEAWEAGIDGTAHRMKIPVPDLAGYVVSRIGTPKASTRRTVQVPVRATHMDTLMPQDFVLDIEFRGGGAGVRPIATARTSHAPEGKTVPMSWMVGAFGVFAVTIAVIIALFMSKMG